MLVRQGYICVTVAGEGEKNNFDGLKTTRPRAVVKPPGAEKQNDISTFVFRLAVPKTHEYNPCSSDESSLAGRP